MTIGNFLELVEIKAKTASIFPFLFGAFYAWYHYQNVNFGYLVLFFIGMLLWNMAVDANDNYQDYHRAERTEALAYRKKTNIIGRENLNASKIGWMIFILGLIGASIGIFLVTQTGWPLLVMGLFCYAVGYLYGGGPVPISALPLGEFFSGFTMGTVIPMIVVYLSLPMGVSFNWSFIWPLLLATSLEAFAIAALMLANNTCDAQEDEELHRHTIVHYFGVKGGLILFATLYVLGYVGLILAVWLGLLPKLSLLTLLTIPIVWKNTHEFFRVHIKNETFIIAIKNLFLITLVQTIAVGLGVWLNI